MGYNSTGGYGGGAIELLVSGTLTNNGSVSANGTAGTYCGGAALADRCTSAQTHLWGPGRSRLQAVPTPPTSARVAAGADAWRSMPLTIPASTEQHHGRRWHLRRGARHSALLLPPLRGTYIPRDVSRNFLPPLKKVGIWHGQKSCKPLACPMARVEAYQPVTLLTEEHNSRALSKTSFPP